VKPYSYKKLKDCFSIYVSSLLNDYILGIYGSTRTCVALYLRKQERGADAICLSLFYHPGQKKESDLPIRHWLKRGSPKEKIFCLRSINAENPGANIAH
jgi:hypothetical protein